ncbi:Gp15 family bacteriophage protein [Ligilactobacillus salivarius]|uniref:Gp15 family bacteriophage protein n=1 Tax=Ligilactobacillus salivarius TaxID=1624 RepID=UPI003F888618
MLSLTEPLKSSYTYQGKEYQIDLSFDNVIRMYNLLEDDTFQDTEKIVIAFEMFFGFEPKDAEFAMKAIDEITGYISKSAYGDDPVESDVVSSEVNTHKLFSYTQDAGAIYASFKQQYNIDLIAEQGKMHWDVFKALFDGLDENTYFRKILDIRRKDISDLQGKELTSAIEAQNYYELDENKTVEAQEAKVASFADSLKALAQS